MADYDVVGNIAIIKSENENGVKSKNEKIKQAKEIFEKTSVKSVVEKASDVHGRLRTIKVKHVAGKKNLIADYNENNCRFKFNIESCYFSSRLAGERKLISEKVKRRDKVLVMFAGVGVYPIVIYKYSRPIKVVGIEIGRDCCKWFKENLKLNKIPEHRIEIVQGDVKKKINKEFAEKEKFDVVVMTRPNLKESFLEQGLKVSKKGTKLFYYGFCNVDEINQLVKQLIEEAGKLGRRLKKVEIVKAGDIAPYKHRYRIEFKVIK